MLGRVPQWKESFGNCDDFIQLLVRILGIDNTADHLDQRVHPGVLLQATDGARRQLVLDAGSLLGVKEAGVVQQQTQGQAAA
jgi:hypothetical protein